MPLPSYSPRPSSDGAATLLFPIECVCGNTRYYSQEVSVSQELMKDTQALNYFYKAAKNNAARHASALMPRKVCGSKEFKEIE